MRSGYRTAFFCIVAVALGSLAPAAQAATDAERVAQHKKTILSRMKRDPVTFRGDKPGEIRVKWEWYVRVIRNYFYEKQALLTEVSAGEKYEVRTRWLYKNMKVTFDEIFQLGSAHDDKLLPIQASDSFLEMVPRATVEGLTLLGKQGEVKGTITRKYLERGAYGLTYARLEYKDKEGKLQVAGGLSMDAFTLRWKDVKDRVADDLSEAKALEDLELTRDALFPESPAK